MPGPLKVYGHNMTWGCDKNNSRGERIDDFITDNSVCLFNDGSYTYLQPATETFTAIDLSLCSPNIYMEIDFMVESDSYGSDNFSHCFENLCFGYRCLTCWNFNPAD